MFRSSKKTPGTDDLPTEFYNKNVWLDISTNLVNTYTLNFEEVLAKDRGKIKNIIVV